MEEKRELGPGSCLVIVNLWAKGPNTAVIPLTPANVAAMDRIIEALRPQLLNDCEDPGYSDDLAPKPTFVTVTDPAVAEQSRSACSLTETVSGPSDCSSPNLVTTGG